MFPSPPLLKKILQDSEYQMSLIQSPSHMWNEPTKVINQEILLSGVVLNHVSVPDVTDSAKGIVELYAEALDEIEDYYLLNSDSRKLPFVKEGQLHFENEGADFYYNFVSNLKDWRINLVPSAKALFPSQRLSQFDLLSEMSFDTKTRAHFTYLSDAIGIRSRARLMSDLSLPYGAQNTRWVSLACGAAAPVLDAIEHLPSHHSHLSLVDIDAEALQFAKKLASMQDMVEGRDFSLLQRNLIKDLVIKDELLEELGENSYHLVDALGIFEYFSDKYSVKFLRNSYRLVKPGGALIFANMLKSRPHMNVNKFMLGWPKVIPRTVEEVVNICLQAGISTENIELYVPQDGVYVVVKAVK